MRVCGLPLSILISLAAPLLAVAQDQNSNSSSSSNSSSTYAQDCVSALQAAGFTQLAETLTKINETEQGQALFSELSSGRNYTVFAPNDAACTFACFFDFSPIFTIFCCCCCCSPECFVRYHWQLVVTRRIDFLSLRKRRLYQHFVHQHLFFRRRRRSYIICNDHRNPINHRNFYTDLFFRKHQYWHFYRHRNCHSDCRKCCHLWEVVWTPRPIKFFYRQSSTL